MDPREDQAAQKEPKVVFCTFWGKIREVFSEQKKKKKMKKKLSFMCTVAKIITASTWTILHSLATLLALPPRMGQTPAMWSPCLGIPELLLLITIRWTDGY